MLISSWLSGVLVTAREWLRVGHSLRTLTDIAVAFDDERLSYAKVRELTRLAVDHADHQAELVAIAERCTANDLGRELAAWSGQFEDPAVRDRRHHRERGISCRTEHDGLRVMTVRLPPLQMGLVEAAIDTAVMTTKRGAQRIAPQSFIRAMIHDAVNHPINVSGRHRYPTDRQKLLVKERDRTCTDCGGSAFLHHHHEPPFETSRRTLVDELQLKCSACHRRIHADDR